MTYLLRATFQLATGLPEDVIVNTFHLSDAGGEPDWEDVFDAFQAFWNTDTTTTNSVGEFYSGYVDRPASRFDVYDQLDPEPRPVIATRTWSLVAASGSTSNLPSEVALCSSFQGARLAGTIQARRRGRVYLGPFHAGTISSGAGNPGRPTNDLCTTVAAATLRLVGALITAGCPLVVYSRVADSSAVVSNGWVDYEWDTQRRRGVAADTRETWSVSP